jgi:AcrR family transcriptional regulator
MGSSLPGQPRPGQPRRVPRQKRGERRVAGLLEAAATLIAELGYDAVTMSAVAACAGASIGSLYQFFPHKEALAQALRAQYGQEIVALWAPLEAQAATLPLKLLVDQLINVRVDFIYSHPAFLPLLDVASTGHAPGMRDLLRKRIVRLLRARRPQLPPAKIRQMADVVLQIIKGLLFMYARAKPEARTGIVEEFKAALVGYLRPRFGP